MTAIRIPKIIKRGFKYYKKELIENMILLETNNRNQLILKLLYSSALRKSEIANLKIKDISFDPENLWGNKIINGKGGRDRSFLIGTKVMHQLKVFLGERLNK